MKHSFLRVKMETWKWLNIPFQKGASDWNIGLVSACKSGNLEIVELMLCNGNKRKKNN